jgi:Tfp pilus assembly protein PilF
MRRKALPVILLIVLVAASAAAWWLHARPHGPGARSVDLNVLLITVDTLRADAVGSYGGRAPTPWMDRLAADGVRFENAHAHTVVTLPSHANILSGRLPMDHGVRDNSGFRFPGGVDTLATLLKARGYRTGAFVSAFPLAARFGLARGFDVYDDAFVDAAGPAAFLVQERPGTETVARARRWLDAGGGAPSFAWVHLYEPHFPYAPPEPFAARSGGDRYAGEVAAADDALGPLLEPVLAQGEAGRTLIVLTADHGESLGEHGEATHGIFAYEATLRVPLLLYQPRLFAPRVVTSAAGHVDVLPTVLDALGTAAPSGIAGRSLLAEAEGGAGPERRIYFEALSGSLNRGWAPLHGVLLERTKYVDLPLPEVYDLAADPREATNLAARDGGRLESLRAALQPFRAADRGPARAGEDAETRERLRSLGYLSASAAPPSRASEEDDPKRLIALDALFQEVADRYLAGDLPGAIARCRALVDRRPGMALSLLQLAQLERETGDLPAATATLRRALAVSPGDGEVASLLGGSLTQMGRAAEAVAFLEPYAGRPDAGVEVLVAYALALAKRGRTAPAVAALGRAREIEPGNAMLLVDLGTVQLMAGDGAHAEETFESALRQNPRVARAHSSLGAIAAGRGDEAAAAAHWRAAVALDPREYEKLLALGLGLWRQQRFAEARLYLAFFSAEAPPARYAAEIARVRAVLAARPAA